MNPNHIDMEDDEVAWVRIVEDVTKVLCSYGQVSDATIMTSLTFLVGTSVISLSNGDIKRASGMLTALFTERHLREYLHTIENEVVH